MNGQTSATLSIDFRSSDGDRERYDVKLRCSDWTAAIGQLQEVRAEDRQAIAEKVKEVTQRLSVSEFSGDSAAAADLAEKLRRLGILLCNTYVPAGIREDLEDLTCPLAITTELNDLPWELLHPGGNDFLGLRVPLVRYPVVSSYKPGAKDEWRKPRRSPISALLACNPGQPPLPMVEDEVERLDHLLQSEGVEVRRMGQHPVEDSVDLRARLADGQFTLVHFAGHGHFDEEDPHHSSIKVLAANGTEQEVTAQQLYDNMAGAPVLFLNACQSAREAPEARDFLYLAGRTKGFASLVISAGAVAFVGAQWPVLDQSAALFSLAFYRHLLAGDRIGQAMLKARQACSRGNLGDEIRALLPHNVIPELLVSKVTWANFVLYGGLEERIVKEDDD